MVGWLAKVLAGHDKNQVYFIIEETDTYVTLVDGKYKTIAKPKRKNKKHIQIWKPNQKELLEIQTKLSEKSPIRDEEIKRAIKLVMKNEREDANV